MITRRIQQIQQIQQNLGVWEKDKKGGRSESI